jgi:hypothetical protein
LIQRSSSRVRCDFWLDGSLHSALKVKSSVIRLVKRAFQDSGISLPDEAREIIFPNGVPVRVLDGKEAAVDHHRPKACYRPTGT